MGQHQYVFRCCLPPKSELTIDFRPGLAKATDRRRVAIHSVLRGSAGPDPQSWEAHSVTIFLRPLEAALTEVILVERRRKSTAKLNRQYLAFSSGHSRLS